MPYIKCKINSADHFSFSQHFGSLQFWQVGQLCLAKLFNKTSSSHLMLLWLQSTISLLCWSYFRKDCDQYCHRFIRIYNEHLLFINLMFNFEEHRFSTKPKCLLKITINLRFSKNSKFTHLSMRALLSYESSQITFLHNIQTYWSGEYVLKLILTFA